MCSYRADKLFKYRFFTCYLVDPKEKLRKANYSRIKLLKPRETLAFRISVTNKRAIEASIELEMRVEKRRKA